MFKNTVGVKVPDILLPREGVSMEKWAVVACDQFTSQPEYWEEAERIVGDAPSTLRLMLPEMYLEKPDEAERIVAINAAMERYMAEGTLESQGEGFMFVRRTAEGNTRNGLIVALDLEEYDYSKGSETLIRASEGTIVERIPPRLRIRKDASLELPHILVLIDDPERTVIEPLEAACCEENKAYECDLMLKGGHIAGWMIKDADKINGVLRALEALAAPEYFAKQYGEGKAPMLFAMGDGNHSFATAKANWEALKPSLSEEEKKDHPARYALVELENIHDEGILFEPIHRVLFNLDSEKALEWLVERLAKDNGGCKLCRFDTKEACEEAIGIAKTCGGHILPFVTETCYGYLKVNDPAAQLEVGTLQNALDAMLKEMSGVTIDYIHGADVVYDLGSKSGNMGFLLPPMAKSAFFPTVVFDGALPRKTFSMGEANEKRYYLECRKIK